MAWLEAQLYAEDEGFHYKTYSQAFLKEHESAM